jgi:hypothetical protein
VEDNDDIFSSCYSTTAYKNRILPAQPTRGTISRFSPVANLPMFRGWQDKANFFRASLARSVCTLLFAARSDPACKAPRFSFSLCYQRAERRRPAAFSTRALTSLLRVLNDGLKALRGVPQVDFLRTAVDL